MSELPFLLWFAGLLRYAAPVALAALGETISQKAGILNIGLEGTMLAAAFGGFLTSFSTGSPWVGLGVAIAIGTAVTLLQTVFTLSLGVDQVVAGMALNLLALGATSALFKSQFSASGQLVSIAALPQTFGGFDLITLSLPLLVLAVGWLLFRTKWGLALRGVGEVPKAVAAAGFNTYRLKLQAILLSGALAGLAGGYLALGIAASFAINMTSGRGFVAIAMVTFGRWKPVWVFAACLLLGAAESMQFALQARSTGIPSQFFLALPYLVALTVLIVAGRGTQAPAALGLAETREA